MTQALSAVRATVTVPLPADAAYEAFVRRYGAWVPEEFTIGSEPRADVVIEERAGGRWYERGAAGAETDWGKVLAADPGSGMALAWHIGPDWAYDPDPEHASVVRVTFTPVPGGTETTLEHSAFERHGEGAPALRDQMEGDSGYDRTLAAFARYCANHE